MIRTALLSVSDKTNIVDFARELITRKVRIVSTGGTAKLLLDNHIPVIEIAQLTGFPEMLDGRVKTLHPKVHAGILARRDVPSHMHALQTQGIETIDLLAVNLYPFETTTAQAVCSFADAVENIDIGGPTMLRAAAKNHSDVTVLVHPVDYGSVLAEMDAHQGATLLSTRFALAKKVFIHTAQYDGAIANFLSALPDAAAQDEQADAQKQRARFPESLNLNFNKIQDLRYGENPHQSAAFYAEKNPPMGSLASYQQIQGKELSYNNIADADAAWECVKQFAQTACVIVKHANPCGVALGTDVLTAYQKAFQTDPTSAFGGIIAFNGEVDEVAAQAVSKQFVEVLIAPAYSEGARAVFRHKSNVRLLQITLPTQSNHIASNLDYKRVGGGVLVQDVDYHQLLVQDLKVVTTIQPSSAQIHDLLFAWKVAQYVKSNAIVYCANGMTMGVGAGQMSRLDSARIASIKAQHAGLSLQNSAVASDAFFPFRDGLDVVIDAGATCVIQPGGSLRDDEVIAAANERKIAMVLTGTRHFRH